MYPSDVKKIIVTILIQLQIIIVTRPKDRSTN